LNKYLTNTTREVVLNKSTNHRITAEIILIALIFSVFKLIGWVLQFSHGSKLIQTNPGQ